MAQKVERSSGYQKVPGSKLKLIQPHHGFSHFLGIRKYRCAVYSGTEQHEWCESWSTGGLSCSDTVRSNRTRSKSHPRPVSMLFCKFPHLSVWLLRGMKILVISDKNILFCRCCQVYSAAGVLVSVGDTAPTVHAGLASCRRVARISEDEHS